MCIFSALAILCYDRFVIKNKALQLTQLKKVAFLLTIPFLLSISTSEFRKHWMNLNTFQGRIQMWGSALEVKGEGDEEIRERFRKEYKTNLAIFCYGHT